MNQKTGTWRYYLVNALFTAGRMGIGATAVLYMLEMGTSLSAIANIKFIQGLIIFFAEVPTGLIADHFGRRTSCIMACLCAIGSFLLFYYGDSTLWFAFAEVLNALTISFWSGAFEALVVDQYKGKTTGKRELEYLFVRMSVWACAGTALGGYFGGVLGRASLHWPFLLSISLMVACGSALIILLPTEARQLSHSNQTGIQSRLMATLLKIRTGFKLAFAQGVQDPAIRAFFSLQILIQFMLQPVFHYWQPYFKEFGNHADPELLGRIFFGYVTGQLLVSFTTSELLKRSSVRSEALILGQIILTITCFITLGSAYSMHVAITVFIIMQGFTGSMRNLLSANFNQIVPSEQRATILSSVSFVSRAGMLTSLLILGFAVNVTSVASLYFISAGAGVLLVPLYILWSRYEGRYTREQSKLLESRTLA